MRGVRPLRPGDPSSVGSYKVTGFLGEGGQGSVYLGISPSGERVAIKLLHARFADDEQAVRRFRREAEAARRVAEFCTARVLEVGAVNDEQPYIIGEYVDGPSLQHQVTGEGPVQGPALMRLAITTATALVAIHGSGVVHRDFKPSNVLLGPDGPRVIDFGIARALDISQSLTTGIVGTPAFMAPEQFLGEASPASDVFAWAGTMVFAATGRVAFGFGPLPVVMHRILNMDPDLSGVPGEIAPLLWASLAKDPRHRPTAEQLVRDLIRAGTAGSPGMTSPPPGSPGTTPPPPAQPSSGPQAYPAEAAGGPRLHTPPEGNSTPGLWAGGAPYGGTPPASGARAGSGGPHGEPIQAPAPQAGALPGGAPQAYRPMPYPVGGPVTPPQHGPTTQPQRRRRRAALISAGAAATALVTGVAVWLVAQADTRTLPGPSPTHSLEAQFGTAVTSVANPSTKRGGTLRIVSSLPMDSTDPGKIYQGPSLNLVRLYGRALTMFRPAPGAAGTEIVPDLAESLGIPSDGAKTWTYKLRQGVKYQDGAAILSKDVKYAILRSLDPSVLGTSDYFRELLDLPTGYQGASKSPNVNTDSAIQTPDDRTIVFHLKKPYSMFDQVVQLPVTIPMPARDGTRANIVASGPYKIEQASSDLSKIALVRNSQWDAATDPNRRALPDRYEIEYDLTNADQRLQNGDATLGPLVPDERMPGVLSDPALKKRADTPLTTSVRMLAINPEVAPFDNVECRRAVVRALRLKDFALAYGTAQAQAPTSLLPPTIPGHRWRDQNLKADGDPQAAKESLAACGHPSGFATTYIYRDMAYEQKAAQVVQRSLAQVGIKLTLKSVPTVDFFKKYGGSPEYLKQNKVGLIAKPWGADWPDPDAFLALIADSRKINAKSYSFNVSVRVRAIDDLMDKARAELDPAKRDALWNQVEQKLAEEAVLVPLTWSSPLLLRGMNATNVHVSPVFADYDLLTMGVR
ncbi:ABC transporter substrate-binding protein [Nonomuraea sp. NPDC049784]|uniref:ABC transporter substrate-binding protein n=1 Tax=Nonomuraea sp. NPDC049784 TaxID=3154361 RepID=UPI003406BD85